MEKTIALFCLLLLTLERARAPATPLIATGRQAPACPTLLNSPGKWDKIIGYLRMTTVSNRRMTERQVMRLIKDLACATAGNLDRVGRDASTASQLCASAAASLACLVAIIVSVCLQRCMQTCTCPLPPAAPAASAAGDKAAPAAGEKKKSTDM